jgi:aspartate/tyrosine/aromatic aminotransferase
MFNHLRAALPDPIFDLMDQFRRDPRADKINLTAGVYQDERGQTPVFACIRQAGKALVNSEPTKSYLPIEGLTTYTDAVKALIFGPESVLPAGRSRIALQTPGGTGALRIAVELLRGPLGMKGIWCSNPTWANHLPILAAAGLPAHMFPYLNTAGTDIDEDSLLQALRGMPRGAPVLLHVCCHNPAGFDPSPALWDEIVALAVERELLPVLDFAYQGFAESLEEDPVPVRKLERAGCNLIVAYSNSKNFGVYGERVGALCAVLDRAAADALLTHMKSTARVMYSNPPRHGASLVAAVLADPALRRQWESELAAVRHRIARMRRALVERLAPSVPDEDFSFLLAQRGMFGYVGLAADHVDRMRRDFGIYMLPPGRINVAGLNDHNLDYFCRSLSAVLACRVA